METMQTVLTMARNGLATVGKHPHAIILTALASITMAGMAVSEYAEKKAEATKNWMRDPEQGKIRRQWERISMVGFKAFLLGGYSFSFVAAFTCLGWLQRRSMKPAASIPVADSGLIKLAEAPKIYRKLRH